MKVTVIGLGNMGGGIAQRVVAAGFVLTVYNRNAEKMRRFVRAGAAAASSVEEAVSDADLVITSLFDDASELDLTRGALLAAMRPGAIHLSATTISPDCAIALARLHAEAGSVYVAGPVVGRPDAAEAGQLLTFLAGSASAIEQATPVCRAYARQVVVVGPHHATALAIKLGINYCVAGMLELMGEVYAFGERSGVEPEIFQAFFTEAFAAAPLKIYAAKIVARAFDATHGFTAAAGLKDLDLMRSSFGQVGASFAIGAIVRGKLQDLCAAGQESRDWSALALPLVPALGPDGANGG